MSGKDGTRPESERTEEQRTEERREIAAEEDVEREEATYSPERNRLREVFLLFAALWRLVRGEDGRGRKVRWLIGLLRPYRAKVALMFVGLLAATGAALVPLHPPHRAG